MYNFDPYNVFLAFAANIPVWLMTGFVVQGHKWWLHWGIYNGSDWGRFRIYLLSLIIKHELFC